MKGKIPITVVTGFLGSGKTSLINEIISQTISMKPAIIVNEFGEIGLDHKLIQKSDDKLILLNNGCLCCLLQSDLANTLRELLLKRNRDPAYNFDSIIIETSGIADPAGVIQTLIADETIQTYYQFKKLVTVVDATIAISRMIEQHDIFFQQILHADDICISKTDKMNLEGSSEKIMNYLAEINPAAKIYYKESKNIVHKVFSNNPIQNTRMMKAKPKSAITHHRYHTCNVIYDKDINLNKLLKCLEAIIVLTDHTLLRVKGFVSLEGRSGSYVINCVQNIMDDPYQHKSVRSDDDSRCQLTFISSKDISGFIQSACDYAWQ